MASDPFHALAMAAERLRYFFSVENAQFNSTVGKPQEVFPKFVPASYGSDMPVNSIVCAFRRFVFGAGFVQSSVSRSRSVHCIVVCFTRAATHTM
jgi:hypothetical protein